MRISIALVATAATLAYPAAASAQDDEDCPPGGWFCEEEEELGNDEVGAEDDAAKPEPVDLPDRRSRRRSAPPVVVYTPAGEPPPKVVVVSEATEKPPPPKRRKRRRLGINARLQGVMMGDSPQRDEDAGMGGVGVSFRYRPVPHFSLDIGLDALGGTDWQGNKRDESALLLSAILFFNPRNAVQVYTIGGFGFSGADVEIEDDLGETTKRKYSYFGGHLGFGLEFRVSHLVSLNVDMVGFIRGRTDERAREEPEFIDPETGRTTNASGGGLFRGGITFYW